MSTGSGPEISVDTSGAVPPYEQIRSQLDDLIRTGRLDPDQRLPPVRQLANDLGVSAGVVARAYRELEATGRVRTRRGGGTTVVGADVSLDALARTYVDDARRLGFSDRELEKAVRQALRHPD